ncbi:DUF3159 domain-containing protein [Leifsonia kafniensis]|uniref:DUF3159 domain-containing protein n=1 Tax=Leifsonia kafniensis TaxID=475957 RepID=A0ABP7K509_9MICO
MTDAHGQLPESDPEDSDSGRSAAEPDRTSQSPESPESFSSTLGQGLAAAAKRSGLGGVAEGQAPTGAALLKAMGGIRGMAETILPGLVFLVLYSFTFNLPLALGASVGVAVIFTVLRIIGRTPVTQAAAGLIGVAASAALALISGKGSDNFVLGLWTNAGYAAALLVSILVGWPLIGLAVGYLMGDGVAWRVNKGKYRAMQLLTLAWLGMFVARLVVQLPLYLADNVAGLAVAKLIMGIPLYAPLLLLSWLVVRAVYRRDSPAAPAGTDTPT